MSGPPVEIVIERLVLHGIDPADPAALRQAVERALARELAAADPGGLAASTGLSAAGIDAGTTDVAATARTEAFAGAIAAKVAGGLKR